jgi:pfkB family carbohydrate kinase
VIVVVGSPSARSEAGQHVADGLSALVAIAVAVSGRPVQIVGRIGDDDAADAVLQDLTRAGVGHVAILRDPARATPLATAVADTAGSETPGSESRPELDAADVELAMRYLTDFRVIVLIEPATGAVAQVVARATDWGEATLIIARSPAADPAAEGAAAAEAPARGEVVDRDGAESEAAFAGRVAALAIALDSGLVPTD